MVMHCSFAVVQDSKSMVLKCRHAFDAVASFSICTRVIAAREVCTEAVTQLAASEIAAAHMQEALTVKQ